jgi:hypothetical protein
MRPRALTGAASEAIVSYDDRLRLNAPGRSAPSGSVLFPT